MIDFLVQMPNLQLGFQIDFVIVFRAQTVARFGTVLTHHNDRRLDGGQTGENQIEKNERIRIEGFGSEQDDIGADPHEDDSAKANKKFPTAAEFSDAIGEAFAKSKFLFELLLDVAGNDLVLAQTFDNLLIEHGEFSDFLLQHFLDVILSRLTKIVEADEAFFIKSRHA